MKKEILELVEGKEGRLKINQFCSLCRWTQDAIGNEVDRLEVNFSICHHFCYCYQCGDSMNGEDNYCRNCGLGLNPQTIYKCGKCIYESELECEVCPSCGCNVIVEITSGGGRIEKTK